MKCAICDCNKEKCSRWKGGTCQYIITEEGNHETLIQDQADMHGITPPDNSDCTWGGGIAEKTT